MLDYDRYRREQWLKENPTGAFSRMQLAGWLMLALPGSMLLLVLLNSWFHFASADDGDNVGGLGAVLMLWLGLGLAYNWRGYRVAATILCGLYLSMFTGVTVVAAVLAHNGFLYGTNATLILFVPVHSPTLFHYFLLELLAVIFFGMPLYLLLHKPARPAFQNHSY